VPDSVDFQSDWFGDVVADQFKAMVANPLGYIGLTTREVVVKANYFLACLHEAINEMRAKEAGTASD
jgi:hypothetical protein